MGLTTQPDLSDLPKGLQWNSKAGWVIDKVVWGERIKCTLGFNYTRVKAELELEQRVNKVQAGEAVFSENRIRSLTVRSALNTWFVDHLKGMKSEERKHLLTPLDRLLGHIPVIKLKKRDIDFYIKTRLSERKAVTKFRRKPGTVRTPLLVNGEKVYYTEYGERISVNTVRHELSELKMTINNLVSNEIIPRNPLNPGWFKGKELKLPRRKKIVLDHGHDLGPEFLMIYHRISGEWLWKLFYLALYETGMRPAEMKLFRKCWIAEVVPGYYQITIPASDEKTGNTDRRIPVSPRLAKRLIPHIKTLTGDALVFESSVNTGCPIVEHEKQFNKAVAKAGLSGKKITTYALRRTKATMWSAKDDLASRVALGHAPIDPHEESYVEVTTERLFRLIGVDINMRQSMRLYRKVG